MRRFVATGCQVNCQYIVELFIIHLVSSFYKLLISEGSGFLGDAHHITRPHADGRGAILAMERALKQVKYKCQ